MALIPLYTDRVPYGTFDALDSQAAAVKGGECVSLTSVAFPGTDLQAADDGYVGTTSKVRPVVTFTLTSSSRPLFLADEGVSGYGTLFGSLVGGTTGQNVSGTVIGPSTVSGSGKITLWQNAGVYGISLDAVDTVSLTPTNSSLTVGTTLTYTSTGQLTAVGSAAAVSGAPVVARLMNFDTNGSYVTTPGSLVAALNSPSGSVSSLRPTAFTMAVINWIPVSG